MTSDRHPARAGACLVGFMGAGKTSVGRVLATQLAWRFIDLDEVVEVREQRTIAELFRDVGEPEFRRAEAAALRSVLAELASGPIALSVGGGAIVRPENAAAVREARLPIVFLDAPVEVLRQRCAEHGASRPLFQDENQFRQLWESRREHYMKADVRVDTTGLTIEQAATEVVRRLQCKGI